MSSNVRDPKMQRINSRELADAFIAEQIKEIKEQVGDKKVLLALSCIGWRSNIGSILSWQKEACLVVAGGGVSCPRARRGSWVVRGAPLPRGFGGVFSSHGVLYL